MRQTSLPHGGPFSQVNNPELTSHFSKDINTPIDVCVRLSVFRQSFQFWERVAELDTVRIRRNRSLFIPKGPARRNYAGRHDPETRASMLENSICWTTPRFEGTDRERAFFESLVRS